MKLIDKDALVAEIENKINKYTKRGEESDAKRDGYGMYWGGVLSCLNEVRTLCDTLEVEEVDLKEEVANWWDAHYKGLNDDYKFGKYNGHYMQNSTVISLAKHFYELGLKTQKGE